MHLAFRFRLSPRLIFVAIFFAVVVGYWLLPIHGQVLVVSDTWVESAIGAEMHFEPPHPVPGQPATIIVTDRIPWANVQLIVDSSRATLDSYQLNAQSGIGAWYWHGIVPFKSSYSVVFYHDCHTGCIERATFLIGSTPPSQPNSPATIPTKLGIVFANPERDWHGRSGWDVELTYARQADNEYWGVDNLSQRVQIAAVEGLRILVRVDYDMGQSMPPANDYLALDEYLQYLRRLARDERLKDVYGYIIGSGYNAKQSNSLDQEHLVTPEWYARVFNGYETDPGHTDNVIATVRAVNPKTRILVGPVRPWISDQNGQAVYQIDVPWLNYMNSLVAALNQNAEDMAKEGIAMSTPNGFAIQAPGRPDAPELGARGGADEPHSDLNRPEWNGAQAGFRVYRDWLDIINRYPHMRSLPVYVTSTNTVTPDSNRKPAQNYPPGWLSAALNEVNSEPQINALCWYLDDPIDSQWELFSLTNPRGLLVEAADEFDKLLVLPSE